MYVAVKGGEAAIDAAQRLQQMRRRGDPSLPPLDPRQLAEQQRLGVDRVLAEAGLADRAIAALALKQAEGDLGEAVFLLRAYRTTLAPLGQADPLDTLAMTAERRISAIFKDIPGGQCLGATFDYTHRLLDFALAVEGLEATETAGAAGAAGADNAATAAHAAAADAAAETPSPLPHATFWLEAEALLPPTPADPQRADRLGRLVQGDEGFLVALAYSSQRGFGHSHPFVGDLRVGAVPVTLVPEEDPERVLDLGSLTVTECRLVTGFTDEGPVAAATGPHFTQGYGLVPGHNERKAIAVALVDRALTRAAITGRVTAPIEDAEFVLSHCDAIEASGFLEHLKLPHYVDFQSELNQLRQLRADHAARGTRPPPPASADDALQRDRPPDDPPPEGASAQGTGVAR